MKFVKPIIKQIKENGYIIFKYLGEFPIGPPPEYTIVNVTK